MKKYILIVFTVILVACGGGGGSGGATANNDVQSACINTQSVGCVFSTTDPSQYLYGWWTGKRSVGQNSTETYFSADQLGNFQIYIGNDFNTGFFNGSGSTQGSVLSLNSSIGVDPLASSLYSASLQGSNGGVISKKLLNFQQDYYNLAKSKFTMSLVYNSIGDQPVKLFSGIYTKGNYQLSIASDGSITAQYVDMYVQYSDSNLCVLSATIDPATLMKDVLLQGTDSCGKIKSMRLFYFTYANIGHMVLRLNINNNTDTKAIVF
jgi:hypothetical protein